MDSERVVESFRASGGRGTRDAKCSALDAVQLSPPPYRGLLLMKLLSLLLLLLLLLVCKQQVRATNEQIQSSYITAATTSELNLERQALTRVPVKRLCQAVSTARNSINLLSLADNQISLLENEQFTCVSSALRILILTGNQISLIPEETFSGLNWLQVLRLDHNQLRSVPAAALLQLHALRHLNLAYNRIEALEWGAFERTRTSSSSSSSSTFSWPLISLDLKGNPLVRIASTALIHLTRLQTLSLSGIGRSQESEPQQQFEPLEGLADLRFLHLDRMKLNWVPRNLCSFSRKLSSLVLKSNKLERIPQFGPNCMALLLLDLSYNQISGSIERANLSSSPALLDLYLGHNKLTWIHEDAFAALTQLQVLELNDNLLAHIHPLAFLPIRGSIKHLDLARNRELTLLSGIGLEQLISFRAVGNEQLRRLPQLSSARTLSLTHAYHCCEYTPTSSGGSASSEAHEEVSGSKSLLSRLLELLSSLNEPKGGSDANQAFSTNNYRYDDRSALRQPLVNAANQLTEQLLVWPLQQQASSSSSSKIPATISPLWVSNSSAIGFWDAAASFSELRRKPQSEQDTPIRCSPAPSPFQPCRALFDNWWLRAGICCVFLLAFAGNLLVIIVLGSARRSNMSSSALTSIMWPAGHSKRHIDVPRFLVLNLAIADLMMALYLGILAAVDLGTLGEFRLFAIEWQQSRACKLAGFLAVLSSELSVFILAIITLERNYAITNAVHLNRRLSLQKASLIVLLGYSLSLALAILPLQGQVSDYAKYAICLPLEMDSDNLGSQVYAASLISVNTLSFILLLGCYLRMYCAIRGSQAWNANDLRIARRMSILVLTDFLCWMPIICVALGSLAGYQPVGPLGLKLIIIFVLPLNSVANPFLYAITTKKFKRDLDSLMRQLAAFFTKLGSPAGAADGSRQVSHLAGSKSNGLARGEQHAGINRSSNHRPMMRGGVTCKAPASSAAAAARNQSAPDSLAARARVRSQVSAHRDRTKGTTDLTRRPTPLLRSEQAATCSCRLAANGQQRQQEEFSLASKRPKIVLDSAPSLEDGSTGIQEEDRYEEYCNSGRRNRCPPAGSSSTLTLEKPLVMRSSPKEATPFSHLTRTRSSFRGVDTQGVFKRPRLHLGSSPPNVQLRSASACGGSSGATLRGPSQPSAAHQANLDTSNSYETVSATTGSALNWLLVYGPIAKAWSSIQISFSSSASQLNSSNNNNTNLGSKIKSTNSAASSNNNGRVLRQPSNNSAYFTPSTCQDQQQQQMAPLINSAASYSDEEGYSLSDANLNNDLPAFLPGSPIIKQRLNGNFNERRMSRSLDVVPQQQIKLEENIPSSSTDVSGSQAELLFGRDDEQRILLATSENTSSGKRTRDKAFFPREPEAKRSKPCQRCRSWSPALLSKLEGCIYQLKTRIPGLASTARNNLQTKHMDTSNATTTTAQEGNSSSAEITSSADECRNLSEVTTSYTSGTNATRQEEYEDHLKQHQEEQDSSSDDKFNEHADLLVPWKWNRCRSSDRYPFRSKYSVSGRRLAKQNSSTNSDTMSTRTAGTLLTNMSVSSDSSTSIPHQHS